MTDERRSDLPSVPTADQLERFAKLSVEQRFHWLVDMIALCHDLAPADVRAGWRERER